ncbi:nitrogen fixation protein NifB [Gilvimarinus japonicus]|uniref:Nitrogen fixation protein NifB n=1 Tax=Gilvimarinus japonicus TaxID=1796469 RepID=A0ABV7HML4_9GAMM
MTQPRRNLISVSDTPYYHCVSRCVRRAFLCGSGKGYNFEHRRGWIVTRIKQLAAVFTIDVAAYAVMSNHYHVVLRVDTAQVDTLSRDAIIERWRKLFKGPELIQQYMAGKALGAPELAVVDDIVNMWRKRLADISWFMRCLNEPIARWANKEDNCKGHFFEARFKARHY